MKSLLNGCAAVALLVGLAGHAKADVLVRQAPVYAVPDDDEDAAPPVRAAENPAPPMVMAPTAPAPAAVQEAAAEAPRPAPIQVAEAQPARAEPSVVKALMESKAAPAPSALTPEENAFFAVLGKRVTDAASAYESYVRRATAIDPRFADAAAVQKAVKLGAAYQPQQLQEGIVAYAALLALRNDAFVEGVKSLRDPAFADRLTSSPQAVLNVRGADEAASDVAGALRAQGAGLLAAGKSITQAAYDVQGQSWSKTPVFDPKGVLADAKEAAIQPRAASVPAKERLLASLVDAPQAAASSTVAGAPDVVRGLALAALAILGRTGDDKEANFEALLHDASSVDCLKMAKLNLNQCLAVAGPHYEDVYCAGRHGVGETANCVAAAANGASTLLAPPPVLQQRAEGYGPEQAQAYGQPGLRPEDRDDDDTPAAPPQRYASVQPSYQAPPAYAPPAAAPAPAPAQAYADNRQTYAQNTYAQNDRAYGQAPYQDPRGYAAQQPAPAYPQQQQAYAQPQYAPAPAYAAQPSYRQPQPSYAPTPQYPYGYAARGYYGQ
jgi:hypothetical protein